MAAPPIDIMYSPAAASVGSVPTAPPMRRNNTNSYLMVIIFVGVVFGCILIFLLFRLRKMEIQIQKATQSFNMQTVREMISQEIQDTVEKLEDAFSEEICVAPALNPTRITTAPTPSHPHSHNHNHTAGTHLPFSQTQTVMFPLNLGNLVAIEELEIRGLSNREAENTKIEELEEVPQKPVQSRVHTDRFVIPVQPFQQPQDTTTPIAKLQTEVPPMFMIGADESEGATVDVPIVQEVVAQTEPQVVVVPGVAVVPAELETTPDGPAEASKDGASKDEASKDGASKDGASKDGASKDESLLELPVITATVDEPVAVPAALPKRTRRNTKRKKTEEDIANIDLNDL